LPPPSALLRSPEAPLKKKELGALGEQVARAFLEKRGYKVLETNFRTREGETDLIALEGEVVVFAEVKARTSHALGTPQEAVTPRKVERIKNLALEYLATHPNLPP
jgi:putative endonuclease